jgi:polyisoprenoid-binding protein YceI
VRGAPAALPIVAACAVLLCAAHGARAATAWTADPARSRLEFSGRLAGGTFEGRFARFAPAITFDPADLPGSRFEVEIDTASADTQEAERDGMLKGPDFFAVARWPVARFEATRFVQTEPGRFEARGRLTLRDVTREVSLPFRFVAAADGRTATLAGGTRIRRLEFGVGQGDWRDTKWLDDEVEVRFDLLLSRREQPQR